ncbi:WhiB family transcriptional regulator [Streptomyces sp. NPDC101209]|uniref:WhiB family transcriptional regulator n=1 Tax=Streptomyces sp. NPDC101209 TaxID=3366129 RepID=UPI00381E948C
MGTTMTNPTSELGSPLVGPLLDSAANVSATNDIGIPTWLDKAACGEYDTDLFFPVSLEGPGRLQAERAKAVCETCPVREQCANWAINTAQQHGVWGGMDETELAQAVRGASFAPSHRRVAPGDIGSASA